jgi:hypothetical protein
MLLETMDRRVRTWSSSREPAASSSPRALLNALADRARAHGVRYFTALVQAENQQSIQMVRGLGDADRSLRRDVVFEATGKALGGHKPASEYSGRYSADRGPQTPGERVPQSLGPGVEPIRRCDRLPV